MSEREKNELVGAMGETAHRFANRGECCAEAVVHAAIELLAPHTPAEVATSVRGLCGGMGNGKATCGVFSGSAVALGLIVSQSADRADKKRLKEMTARFEAILAQEAGGQICDELKKKMGIRNWNGSQCKKLIRRGAELVAELVLDPGIADCQ